MGAKVDARYVDRGMEDMDVTTDPEWTQHSSGVGLKTKGKRAGWNNAFLLPLLGLS